MLEDISKTWQRKRLSRGVVVTVAVLLVAVGLADLLWWQYENHPADQTVLTEEAKLYLPYLDLSDVQMEAKESFLGHTIVSIEGKISNLGEQTVRLVEVTCVFRDPYLNELGRQAAVIVSPQGGVLDPGETGPFRIAFDAVPQGWNQIMPNLYIAQILFE